MILIICWPPSHAFHNLFLAYLFSYDCPPTPGFRSFLSLQQSPAHTLSVQTQVPGLSVPWPFTCAFIHFKDVH